MKCRQKGVNKIWDGKENQMKVFKVWFKTTL